MQNTLADIVPLVLFLLYVLVLVTGILSGITELVKHRASFNSIKLFFYALYILNGLCRALILAWGMSEQLTGGEFYANFPALLYISYAGLLALQMLVSYTTPQSHLDNIIPNNQHVDNNNNRIQFSPSEGYTLLNRQKQRNWFMVRSGTNLLIGCNLIMYFTAFLLFGLAEREIGDSTSIGHFTSSDSMPYAESVIYSVLDYFFITIDLILFLSHALVAYKTFRTFREIYGVQINIAHASLILLILCRAIILFLSPNSSNSSLSISTGTDQFIVYTLVYYIIGEIIPAFLIIYIEFILPYHSADSYIDLGTVDDQELTIQFEHGEIIGRGGSGAQIKRCTMRNGKGGDPRICVVKTIDEHECNSIDYIHLQDEIRIYEYIQKKSKGTENILNYILASKSKSELRLYLEYMPHTLENYLVARSNCGDKPNLQKYFLNIHFYASSFQMTPQQPYFFEKDAVLTCLLSIAQGLHFLHSNNIIHNDLKPNNVFVVLEYDTEIKQCKIGDFDNSILLRGKGDIINAIDRVDDYTPYFKHDILQFGMIIYYLLTLNLLPKCMGYHSYHAPALPKLDHLTDIKWLPIVDLYQRCVNVDRSQRPNTQEILKLLELEREYSEHPF
ncbi:hypothetical protein SAMD00019534_117350 [Acytostelium subglobosum LB1]|uniref:hypothetical protein n=1 Tax=Acytostelium subglobosum LB1 TaxID=1410327 RepID=UPI000644B938|nr:hypothetical protein SAMD00019534_117350 [Acytostelium subglobosum LB1]GAM28559.1 hypothetical protein SAMD00019534_117350 [Acytostelium subglobosum LB1]|eukprot:XP_012748598.1 hypothetical protein SAMD00019534_117350 [Acytostelium subglobosum LB1]